LYHLTEDPKNLVEDDWVVIDCENGGRSYILFSDLSMSGASNTDTKVYVSGISDVGPGQTDYGRARDLTVAEALRLGSGEGQEPPPKSVKTESYVETRPDPSAPLGLCSTAISDPLRPMIIDMLIAGGKHIAPDWTAAFKKELETEYGSFVSVHDDATVEKVDERTGKVACAVTYDADLQGLAGKALEEGATGRAQVLIRQIAQGGKRISRRLVYTVQKTSGGSLMAWFGITTEIPPATHRRITRCVAAYGGRCLIWR
jgi:hypothetical protein